MASLFIPLGILLIAGLTVLASISVKLFFAQLVAVAVGFLLIFFLWKIDWRALLYSRWFAPSLYVFTLILLIAVLAVGPTIRNVKSWLVVGPLRFQPAELMKAALIFSFALYFSRRHLSVARWRVVIYSFLLALLPALLVIAGPDLGSAVIMLGIWFGILSVSGLPKKRFFILLLIILVGIAGMWSFGLKDYQKSRIMGLIYPERDALGVNYNTIQSKIAIGSSGMWGKGFGQGTQVQLGFLPVPESDFMLSALTEEWGIAGALLVIAAEFMLIVGILRIGLRAEGNTEKFLCLGVAVMFALNFFMNAGSAVGILPVVGVTFPFLSYGGSSMVVNMLLVGFINAIGTHR
jgi:rod shape determining protein RodA